MADDFQDPSDIDEEWGVSTNGSNFTQSVWSYSHLSGTTEPWVEDVFMGSVPDHTVRDDDSSDDVSRLEAEAVVGPGPDTTVSFFGPPDASLALDHSRSCSAFEEQMWTPGPCFSDEYRHIAASPHHSGVHPTSNEPWDPLGLPRVPQYDSGYVAFADSPKSSSEQSFCEAPPQLSVPPGESTIQAAPAARLRSLFLEAPAVATSQQLRWEPVSVAAYGPPRNDDNTWRGTNRRQLRGRHGPLDVRKAQEAQIMRRIGACWPCRVSKLKCSPGSPCRACRDHQLSMSPLSYQVCCRSGIADFDVLYFPAVLVSHFSKKEVKSLIARNVERFIGPGRVVRVHCGSSFTPMELTVHFFRHKTDTLLNRQHFTGPGKERTLKMIIRRCAPVGILGVDVDDLKRECMSCIKSMISHPAYAKQVTAGEKSGIYRRTLEIIHKYSKLEENSLLDNAMQLHAMHYFMARILTFTEDSASMVKKVSRNDLGLDLPSDVISSRLLNRQLKHAMHILHRRKTKIVLQEFERHLKMREQAGWPISFCVVLILSLCMEDIQIAANNFAFTDTEISQGLRSESYKACWELEDKSYRQCTQLFHDMYRSYKQPNSHAADRGFNPILQEGSHQTDWSQATQNMIKGIRQIIKDSQPEMRALSMVSVFGHRDQPQHHSLLDDHPVRLLSRFLLSFLDAS